MCGISSYTGLGDAAAILLESLKRLEYRGYDSAGVTLQDQQRLVTIKEVGPVEMLAQSVRKKAWTSKTGICHTRWATHGAVTQANTHPHLSCDGKIAIVHNGVIENYLKIKKTLLEKKFSFSSETDTEVLANLIAYHYAQNLDAPNASQRFIEAVRKSLPLVQGTYGIAVMCEDVPGQIVGARKGSPLIVGIGNQEHMLASDAAAFLGRASRVVYLEDDQVVSLTATSVSLSTIEAERIEPVFNTLDINTLAADLGDFRFFMEKEIFEQPTVLENAMRGRFSNDGTTAKFGGLNLEPSDLRQIDRILFCSCGTSWHACLIGKILIEDMARIPVEVQYASEFRYGNAPLDKNTLVVVVSQSGETLDTLEALREAKRKGYKTLGITNAVGSSIAKEVDGGIYQHAGPEIGVASTKAFTSQVLILAMFGLYLGRLRNLSYNEGETIVKALKEAPNLVREVLSHADSIRSLALKYVSASSFLFIGRQQLFPVALEGALKLKEISYIHAEGYPAAEIKHGPIALIGPQCPTVALALNNELFLKTVSNMMSIKARGGKIIAVTSEGFAFPKDLADDVIRIPRSHPYLEALLAAVPLQLLAYFIGVERGCDVDKPRHLAKSVTVE